MKLIAIVLALLSLTAGAAAPVVFPEHEGQRWAGVAWATDTGYLPTSAYTDVGTCTSAGLASAITTATGSTNLVRLNCNVTLSGTVNLAAGVTLFSSNGSLVTSPTTSDFIQLNSNTLVTGLRFTGARPLALYSTTFTTGVKVVGNDFTDVTDIAVYGTGTADNSIHVLGQFDRNKFVRCNYAYYFQRNNTSTFDWNDITQSNNRNIQFVGGSSNTAKWNRIDGGITGINMLLTASLGYTASMLDNVFDYNEITNVTEEGIGGDIRGNDAVNIGVFDQFTVEATSGTAASNPTIQVNRTATFDPWRYYVIFQTGALKGRYARLQATMTTVDADSVSFKIDNNALTQAQFASIGIGDRVAIGLVVARTKIRGNYIMMVTGAPVPTTGQAISIYGNMFDSEVNSNVLGSPDDSIDAVRLTTLCGMITSTKFANNWDSGSKTCAPVDGNKVFNNIVVKGYIKLRGKTYNNLGNSYLVGQVYSNPVYNNVGPAATNALWDSQFDDNTHSPAPSDASVIGTWPVVSAAYPTLGSNVDRFSKYRLPASSPYRSGAQPISGFPADARGCPFEVPWPYGIYANCGGEPSAARSPAP